MTGTWRVTAAAASALIAVGAAGCGSAATSAGTKAATTTAPTATTLTTSAASTVPPATVTSLPTSTASATTTTAPAINYQAQYLKDVAAPDAYTASVRSATYGQLDKLAGLVTANANELRQQSWSGSAQTDVGKLATALDAGSRLTSGRALLRVNRWSSLMPNWSGPISVWSRRAHRISGKGYAVSGRRHERAPHAGVEHHLT